MQKLILFTLLISSCRTLFLVYGENVNLFLGKVDFEEQNDDLRPHVFFNELLNSIEIFQMCSTKNSTFILTEKGEFVVGSSIVCDENQDTPVLFPTKLNIGIENIGCSDNNVIFRSNIKKIRACGIDDYGEMTIGSTDDNKVVSSFYFSLDHVTQIVSGENFTFLKDNKKFYYAGFYENNIFPYHRLTPKQGFFIYPNETYQNFVLNEVNNGNTFTKVAAFTHHAYYLFENGLLIGSGQFVGLEPTPYNLTDFDDYPTPIEFWNYHQGEVYSDVKESHIPYFIECVKSVCLMAAYDSEEGNKTDIFTWGMDGVPMGRPSVNTSFIPKFIQLNEDLGDLKVLEFQIYKNGDFLVFIAEELSSGNEKIFTTKESGDYFVEDFKAYPYKKNIKINKSGSNILQAMIFYTDIFCYGEHSTSDTVCGSHGNCTGYDHCECNKNWDFFDHCNVTTCNNIFSNAENVCNMGGECVDYNECLCKDGLYDGPNCENCNKTVFCNGDNSISCKNTFGEIYCECTSDYFGDNCSDFLCFGESYLSDGVCNGFKCTGPDECTCEVGEEESYYQIGEECQAKISKKFNSFNLTINSTKNEILIGKIEFPIKNLRFDYCALSSLKDFNCTIIYSDESVDYFQFFYPVSGLELISIDNLEFSIVSETDDTFYHYYYSFSEEIECMKVNTCVEIENKFFKLLYLEDNIIGRLSFETNDECESNLFLEGNFLILEIENDVEANEIFDLSVETTVCEVKTVHNQLAVILTTTFSSTLLVLILIAILICVCLCIGFLMAKKKKNKTILPVEPQKNLRYIFDNPEEPSENENDKLVLKKEQEKPTRMEEYVKSEEKVEDNEKQNEQNSTEEVEKKESDDIRQDESTKIEKY